MAADQKVRVHSLLLRAKILASRLDHPEFDAWISLELDGYPKEATLPEYRRGFRQIIKGNFAGMFGRAITNAQLPSNCVPEDLRFFWDEFDIRYPISTVEDFANMPDAAIQIVLPPELPQFVTYYQDMNCLQVWAEQPRHGYGRILEAVRERILRYAIEIERANPSAGEAAPGEHPVSREKLGRIQNIILGGTTIVAAGDAYQYIFNVVPGDLSSLLTEAARLGLEPADIEGLKAAVSADGAISERKFGQRVRDWLGKMTEKAASGAWAVTTQGAAQVLAEAVMRYYGLR